MFAMLSKLLISGDFDLIIRCASDKYILNCDCVRQYPKAMHSIAVNFKYTHIFEAKFSNALLPNLNNSCLAPVSKALQIKDTELIFLKQETISSRNLAS